MPRYQCNGLMQYNFHTVMSWCNISTNELSDHMAPFSFSTKKNVYKQIISRIFIAWPKIHRETQSDAQINKSNYSEESKPWSQELKYMHSNKFHIYWFSPRKTNSFIGRNSSENLEVKNKLQPQRIFQWSTHCPLVQYTTICSNPSKELYLAAI